MKNEELKEVLEMLRKSGLEPMLCDTRVPLSDCPARCGVPATPGDDTGEGFVLLPKSLVGAHPELFIPAVGDSMIGANYEEGDRLRVVLNVPVHDGDNVLASIDNECTVKTYLHDEEGQQWLVPQNERYDAILLTEDMNVRILGLVAGVEKVSPRTSYRDCLKTINRTKSKLHGVKKPDGEQVDGVIRTVAAEVVNARQWYAVYRPLADSGIVSEGCFREFCLRVERVVPHHAHLPVAKELGRLAVQSFRKRVALWEADDAPVSGQRYADYLRIAKLTIAHLKELKLPPVRLQA